MNPADYSITPIPREKPADFQAVETPKSDTPRTDAAEMHIQDCRVSYVVDSTFAETLEKEITALRKELAEVTAAFQAECDHDWEFEDRSFDHAHGCEKVHSWDCSKCGASRDTRPDDMPDPADVGCDDDEPDYDAERPLTPLENWQRNDEHNL